MTQLHNSTGLHPSDGKPSEAGPELPVVTRDPAAYFTANPIYQATSVWMTGQQDAKTQRSGRYVAASVTHPAKMLPAIAAHAIHHFSHPGDLVLDPMCGIGTTLVEAVRADRHALGTEYEPQWAVLARANLALARTAGADGVGRVVCADARDLPKVIQPALADLLTRPQAADPIAPEEMAQATSRERPVALIVTSPPYGAHTHGQVTAPGPGQAVGKSDFRYSPTRRGSGNLAHSGLDDLLAGFTEILAGAVTLLRPGGYVVLTTRPYRRGGELVDLPSAVIAAAQNAGLTLVERNPALMAGLRQGRLIPRTSFFQLLAARQARAAGIPQQVPVHEDVIVLRYDPPTAAVPLSAAPEGDPPDGVSAPLWAGADRLAA